MEYHRICFFSAVLCCVGCVGDLKSNGAPSSDSVDMSSPTPQRDMWTPIYNDMGELVDFAMPPAADMGEDMSAREDMTPDMSSPPRMVPDYLKPTYNPNEAFSGRQQELFTCEDLSAPIVGDGITLSRLQRIESVEWVRNSGLFFGTRHTRVKKDNPDTSAREDYPAEAERTPFEVVVKGGYSTWRQQAQMNSAVISGHVDLMPYASRNWVNRVHAAARHSDLDCMYDESGLPDEACVTTFVTVFLEDGVLFRPPSAEEVTQLVDHAMQDVLPDESAIAQTRKQSIELIYSAAQLTTAALFKAEQGERDASPDQYGRIPLTDWEIAQKVGYALKRRAPGAPALRIPFNGSGGVPWDLPDAERDLGHLGALRQAARDGTIRDRAVLADLIRQYATGIDPERYDLPTEWRHLGAVGRRAVYWMSEGIRRFFREWLEAEYILTSFKDSAYATSKHDNLADVIGTSQEWPRRGQLGSITKSYDAVRLGAAYKTEPTLLQQLDDTIARVVQSDQDVLRNLLTTREFYTSTGEAVEAVNKDVPHFVYNVEAPVEVNSQESRWRTMPASERAGILTHPTWLAAHSENFEDGPAIVKRGYWIQKHLLCGFIPAPGEQIDLTLPDIPDQSARERIYGGTEDPNNPKTAQCQGCHALMNPLGYPFEYYNHAGFLRENDHGSPRDGSSLLTRLPENSDLAQYNGMMVQDPMEFTSILANSTHVKQCFIRHTFRYFMGRAETKADACTLAQMEQAYDMSNGSFVEMLVALMTSDAFLYVRPWDDPSLQGE